MYRCHEDTQKKRVKTVIHTDGRPYRLTGLKLEIHRHTGLISFNATWTKMG